MGARLVGYEPVRRLFGVIRTARLDDLSTGLELIPNGIGIPGDIPERYWPTFIEGPHNDAYKQGNGDWVPRPTQGGVGVPDAGSTVTLLAASMAGLAIAGRLGRVAAH